jgi:hypothetical protein
MDDADLSVDEQALLARLADIAKVVDPPDASAYQLGHAAYEFFHLEDELAELVADSDMAGSVVRGLDTGVRLLSYETGRLTLELQLSDDGYGRSVLGQVTGQTDPSGGVAHLELSSGAVTTSPVDGEGRFEFGDIAPVLGRIRVELLQLPPVTTSWFEL